MTTVLILRVPKGRGFCIKLESTDRGIFKLLVETLKSFVPPPLREYDPTTHQWTVAASAANRVHRWLDYASTNLHAQVECLSSESDYEPEDEWTPPPPPKQPKQSGADDAFKALHLLPSAPPEVVKAAYRALAQKHHPDHGGSTQEMQRLNKAWELLAKHVAA